jgi:hypothetical protein
MINRIKRIVPLAVLLGLTLIMVFPSIVSAALPAVRVAAGAKDSYGLAAAFNNANTTIVAGKIGASAGYSAMIFDDITIPSGSKIYSAKITLTANATRASQAVNTRIYGEESASPSSYGAAEDFTARTYTTAYVDFDGSKSWTLNSTYDLTDMTAVVQELFDTYGPYASGSMAFIWKDDTSTADKRLEAYSYDGDSAKAPLLTIYYSPATAYWINDGGTWNDTGSSGHWSASSGGASNSAIVPGPTTDVIFDANSLSADSTVTRSGIAYCKDFDVSGLDAPLLMQSNLESSRLEISGDFTGDPYLTIATNSASYPSYIYLTGSGTTQTLVFDGTLFDGASGNSFKFRNSGGIIELGDNILIASGHDHLQIFIDEDFGYTFNTNNYDITTIDLVDGNFRVTGPNNSGADPTLNLGSSTIYGIDGNWYCTMNAGTSNLIANYTRPDLNIPNLTLYDLTITDPMDGLNDSGSNFSGATIHSLTISGSGPSDDTFVISGNFSAETFTTSLDGSALSLAGAVTSTTFSDTNSAPLYLGLTLTVSGTLTLEGVETSPLNVFSNTFGTSRTITAATVSVTHTNFRDITGAGAGDWNISSDFSGDCGGNSGITFTTPANVYAVDIGGMVNFSNSSIWANISNGVGGSGRVPLPQDTAVFDSHSVVVPGCTITLDLLATSGIDSSLITNTPIFSATTAYFYNSLNIGTVTWSVTNADMYGRKTQSLQSLVNLTNLYIRTLGYSVTLGSDLVCTGTIYHEAGILNTDVLGHYDIQADVFNSYSTTTYLRTIVLNGSYVVLTSTAATTKWYVSSTNLTLQAGTSVIYFTNSGTNTSTFRGAGLTYYYIYIAGAGSYTTAFYESDTFNTIYVDRSVANKTLSGNYTMTISHFEMPTSGARTITITNTDFSMAAGVVLGDYLIISGSAAAGGATFYANVGGHSTNNGGNSGWIWTGTTPPTGQTNNASDITSMGARMNGELLTLGSYLTFTCYFEYGPTAAYGLDTIGSATTLTAVGTFTYYVSPYHQYHYRAVIQYGYADYIYGADKTISLSGAVGQAKAAISDPGQDAGTALVGAGDLPAQPSHMYTEGSTGGIPIAPLIDDAAAESNTPVEAIWFPIAFFLALALGFGAYAMTRTLLIQAIVSGVTIAAFAGGGVLGDGLLPMMCVLVFVIEAVLVWLIQEKQQI